MKMDVATKSEAVNGTPLPQRQPKGQQGNQANKNLKQNQPQQKIIDLVEGAPAEKKPRFNQGGGGPNIGGGPNQNKNFGNKGGPGNRGGGNRGNRGGGGGGQNRGNFQNQNMQNQQNQQANTANQQNNVKLPGAAANVVNLDNKPEIKDVIPQQNQNLQQNLNQQQNQQNRGGNRGGNMGGGGGFGGSNRGGGGGPGGANNRSGGGGGGAGGGAGGGGGGGGPGGPNNRGGDRNRPRGGGGAGGGGGRDFGPGRSDEFFIGQRLRAIMGPTHELPPIETTEEPKFSGRNRLYVGNLTNDVNEQELRELFKPYGEIGELFSNSEKNFAFLKLDYHANAEKAKRELDGTMRKGRVLRVRFAPNATILRVSNLTPFVSNELLYKSFEIFGPVERANVTVDDRGKATGEGVVEFNKKSSANACMRFCSEKCFFLTASLRPCVVEPFEVNDDADGLPDKSLNRKMPDFHHERSVGPRFADLGSFEHEYGTRWKQLHELYKSKQEALKRELKMEEEKLEAQMEYARYEHETELLRQELRKREGDNERKKMEWELREKQAEEIKKRDEENMSRQQTEMQARMLRQEEEMRRRQQENTLFMQAQQLNSLLDQQEGGGGGFGNGGNGFGGGGGSNSPFEFRGNSGGGGGNNAPNNQQEAFSFEFGGQNQNQGGQGNQRGNNGGNNNNNNNNPWERRRRF